MFRANDTRQMSIHDSFLNLPPHIQRLIEKSWAKDFSDVIFPAIHEERFETTEKVDVRKFDYVKLRQSRHICAKIS